MEPRIIERAPFFVVGLQYHGRSTSGEIPQLWRQLAARIHEIASPSPATYGVVGDVDSESGELDYLAGLQVDPAVPVPEGMSSWEIPGGLYAVVLCTLNTIAPAFSQVYDVWLPNSEYERIDGPEFELYGPDYEPGNNDSPMYIYIPVARRAD